MKNWYPIMAFLAAVVIVNPANARPGGCVKGAIVGGIVGHFTGQESGLPRAAHMDCTNAISMTANSKGGRFTNITTGTGGADTHIEPEPSALS
jgi:hypothetical protein